MASSVQRALTALGAPVLVYAPVVSLHELDTAVAYLLRRLLRQSKNRLVLTPELRDMRNQTMLFVFGL